jgi:hypothetical protein
LILNPNNSLRESSQLEENESLALEAKFHADFIFTSYALVNNEYYYLFRRNSNGQLVVVKHSSKSKFDFVKKLDTDKAPFDVEFSDVTEISSLDSFKQDIGEADNLTNRHILVKNFGLEKAYGLEVFVPVKFVSANLDQNGSVFQNPSLPAIEIELSENQRKTLSVIDIVNFESRGAISDETAGILLWFMLSNSDPLTWKHIFDALSDQSSNDFLLPPKPEWQINVDDEYKQWDKDKKLFYNFRGRVHHLSRLFREVFQASSDQKRLVINPFIQNQGGSRVKEINLLDTRAFVAGICGLYSHVCHDTVSLANGEKDNVYLFDGCGGAPGAYFISELASRFVAEGGDLSNVEAWLKYFNQNSKVSDSLSNLSELAAVVFVKGKIDRKKNKVNLMSVGDLIGLHFDSKFYLVQYVGSNTAFTPVVPLYNPNIRLSKEYFQNAVQSMLTRSNYPAAVLGKNGVKDVSPYEVPFPTVQTTKGVVTTSADYVPGDSIFLFSDWLDKYFTKEKVIQILTDLYKKKGYACIPEVLNFDTMPQNIFANRKLDPGSEIKHPLSGYKLIPFLILVRHLVLLGEIKQPNDLYVYLLNIGPIEHDDMSGVMIT